jgi:hypothetical protein
MNNLQYDNIIRLFIGSLVISNLTEEFHSRMKTLLNVSAEDIKQDKFDGLVTYFKLNMAPTAVTESNTSGDTLSQSTN